MNYEYISNYLHNINNIKTKDITTLNNKLIKEHIDVSFLKEHCMEDELVQRTYFEVTLRSMSNTELEFKFIEDNEYLLRNWWHVDQLTQYLTKPIEFKYALSKSKKYIKSSNPYMRRWGYVLFLTGLERNPKNTKEILSLIKDDEEETVRMAEAWLICELSKYNLDEVLDFLNNTVIKYNITGKAIQKICDSLVISNNTKEYVKSLRTKLKENK
jgi:3-methyladenine DNA glycosylase AlkD